MRSIVAWVLVAVWLPVSSHVLLQRFGLIHEVHQDHHHPDEGEAQPGQHEHGEDNHAAADGECLIPSDGMGPDLATCAGTPPALAMEFAAPFAWRPAPRESSGLAPPCTGPPGFPRSWQFLLRAALPVRAPSLLV